MVENCFQTAVFCVVSALSAVVLRQYCREQSMLLALFACGAVITGVLGFFGPMIGEIREIFIGSGIDEEYIRIIFKAAAITIIVRITVELCCDSGESALGAAAEFWGRGALTYISLPLLKVLLNMIGEMLT